MSRKVITVDYLGITVQTALVMDILFLVGVLLPEF